MADAVKVDGRLLGRQARLLALRRGLQRRRLRLERSLAHNPNPRSGDLERWAELRAEVAEFERLLAAVEAGENPPPSPLTGSRTRELPNAVS